MTPPRAAWVMVNHNGGEEVLASVRSLLADLSPLDRLILIDNGSSDGSGPRAAAAGEVLYRETGVNLPFAEATNLGIRLALDEGCRFIGPINPDVRVRPGMTDRLVEGLERDREGDIAALSPVILYDAPDDRVWFGGGRILWPISWTQHRFRKKTLTELPGSPWDCQFVTGCCWLSPAQSWRRHGFLDPAYGMYSEDVDWSTRVWRAEKRMTVDPSAVLVHRVSMTSGGGRSPFKMVYRTLAARRFFHLWTPPCLRALRVLLTPLFVAFYAVFLYLAEGKRPAEAYLRAWRTPRREPVPWPPSPHLTGKS